MKNGESYRQTYARWAGRAEGAAAEGGWRDEQRVRRPTGRSAGRSRDAFRGGPRGAQGRGCAVWRVEMADRNPRPRRARRPRSSRRPQTSPIPSRFRSFCRPFRPFHPGPPPSRSAVRPSRPVRPGRQRRRGAPARRPGGSLELRDPAASERDGAISARAGAAARAPASRRLAAERRAGARATVSANKRPRRRRGAPERKRGLDGAHSRPTGRCSNASTRKRSARIGLVAAESADRGGKGMQAGGVRRPRRTGRRGGARSERAFGRSAALASGRAHL